MHIASGMHILQLPSVTIVATTARMCNGNAEPNYLSQSFLVVCVSAAKDMTIRMILTSCPVHVVYVIVYLMQCL